MRAQRVILREIASKNLDPKIPYVVDKNGRLKEKYKSNIVDSQITDSVTTKNVETVSTETAVETMENIEVSSQQEEVKPKKKFPPKKKKEAATVE